MKKFIDYVYLTTSVLGAALVALNIGAQLLGYSLFLISSCCALYLLRNSNASGSLFAVNGMFAMINLIGIIRA